MGKNKVDKNKVHILSYQQITNDAALHQYCEKIQHAKCLALDTEFMRVKTFYPHLALLQVFDGEHLALIDPLTIQNWQPFIAILRNSEIDKYFHACGEDIEVFLYQFNVQPKPILDSQILAAFLDNPLTAGYAALVSKYLAIELDKSETRTDWLQRPLSTKQCQYAANDVFYLLPLMSKLKSLLQDNSYLSAAYQECHHAVKRRCVPIQGEKAYLQLKNAWQLDATQLGYLKQLAHWRLDYAKTHDIALNFVIHDEVLWKLARYQPTSFAQLSSLGMKGKDVRLYGDTILTLLAEPTQSIELIKRIVSYPDYKKWTTLIKDAAQKISAQTGLNGELLVSRRHIEQYIKWLHHEIVEEPELLSGWRGELFNEYLVQD